MHILTFTQTKFPFQLVATSKEKKSKTSTILPLYVKTRNQLVKKEVADAEPLELHLDLLQGDEIWTLDLSTSQSEINVTLSYKCSNIG